MTRFKYSITSRGCLYQPGCESQDEDDDDSQNDERLHGETWQRKAELSWQNHMGMN